MFWSPKYVRYTNEEGSSSDKSNGRAIGLRPKLAPTKLLTNWRHKPPCKRMNGAVFLFNIFTSPMTATQPRIEMNVTKSKMSMRRSLMIFQLWSPPFPGEGLNNCYYKYLETSENIQHTKSRYSRIAVIREGDLPFASMDAYETDDNISPSYGN